MVPHVRLSGGKARPLGTTARHEWKSLRKTALCGRTAIPGAEARADSTRLTRPQKVSSSVPC